MADTVLIASVTGIVVSGVVGPAVTAGAARRAARKQFVRDQNAKRREDLRALFDEAARVLGVGAIRLRESRQAASAGTMPDELRDWSDEVYVIGQRIRLRLGATDPVVANYDAVRAALRQAGEIGPDADAQLHEDAIAGFEAARDTFLVAAQAKLDEKITDKELA